MFGVELAGMLHTHEYNRGWGAILEQEAEGIPYTKKMSFSQFLEANYPTTHVSSFSFQHVGFKISIVKYAV
jgi:hypothetical protein